ncbi:DEAD/DEAH box helicase [Halalkalibacillus halophilus]|uniref:DEAD/DEAH box helicase n=1 Tax=Halalkalibacillus halophilus TaxID=392827 RepID=UPI00041FE535|nr:SNF2-related protein [Halalkalibacillus halophilus]
MRVKSNYLMEQIDQAREINCSWDIFSMAYRLKKDSLSNVGELAALKYLPDLKLLPHQLEAVEKIVFQMHGRAILADEVGLGKTIEAAVALKEWMMKGVVKKVLILVPASLVQQWVAELNEKFLIPAKAKHKSYPWESYDIVVTSIDLAKKDPHKTDLLKQDYDLLIVDEAHRLKNDKTISYQLVKELKSTYCLLLTATPIQNKIEEIYNLMQIVRPGLLGDQIEFKKMVQKESYDSIKTLLYQSMVRHRKKDIQGTNANRSIESISVHFNDAEMCIYRELEGADFSHPFTQTTLLREFCSSREACYVSLKKLNETNCEEISNSIANLPDHSKALKAIELIKQLNQKVILFTEYKSTQLYLQWLCQQHNLIAVPYNGKFKKSKKSWMIECFRNKGDVLIATDALAEGLNLQFCHNMIHYDLPWNPMKLEQRIGRIDRYGQKENVSIFYLYMEDTIDTRIMNILYKKLDAFRNVMGEIDQILSSYGISNTEKELTDIIAESKSDEEAEVKINNLLSIVELEQKRGYIHESS